MEPERDIRSNPFASKSDTAAKLKRARYARRTIDFTGERIYRGNVAAAGHMGPISRKDITCCIRDDGVGVTRVTVRRLFRSSG